MEIHEYAIETYQSKIGSNPFEDWIDRLKDKTARARIFQRIDRGGGDKSSQKKDIRKAKQLWEEYKTNAS
ncbi:MAG TPA: hypothetical protein VD913_04970 [bacterium]|nr:hypothetical protein [bacterium]